MDPPYNPTSVEARQPQPATSPLRFSQLHTAGREGTFRSNSRALPLKSNSADSRKAQPERPFVTYHHGASASLWDSQLLTSPLDAQLSRSLRLHCNRTKMCGASHPGDVPGCRLALNGAGGTQTDADPFRGESSTVSTAATLSASPHGLATDIRARGGLSKQAPLSSSGRITGTLLRESEALAPSLEGTYGCRGPYHPGSSIGSSLNRKFQYEPILGGRGFPLVSHSNSEVPDLGVREGSSHSRAASSSALKKSTTSATPDISSRYFPPLRTGSLSSSVSHSRMGLSSSPVADQPPLSYALTAAPCLTGVGSSLTQQTLNMSSASPMGPSDLHSSLGGSGTIQSKACRDGSTSAVQIPATSEGFKHRLAASNLHLDVKGALPAPSYPFERQHFQSAACRGDQPAGDSEAKVLRSADQEQKDSRAVNNSDCFLGSRSAVGPRTERVQAFLGFLKELFLDQDLIPASSVVDCLATLASYAQGLPALHGPTLPWCCVAEQEITPASADPVCLKDRVVVKLLNTLMRAQVLGCAQLTAEPQSDLTALAGASERRDYLIKNALHLVLSCHSSDCGRVSLQPSREVGEPLGSGGKPLIPLGSCSSVALALSAVETLSQHHMPVSTRNARASGSKVHLCYASFLRWLWEELCFRRQHSEPFDVCTSIIACEACSSAICSEAECALLLPKPAGLLSWLYACNIDLAVLLLLSLASRPTRHPLTLDLLERTSFSLDKCSAVGLAAWLRASAVMGMSSLEHPAYFGRVLTALAAQAPHLPLGTVLADVLWGLTLCGIPSGSFFVQAAAGIARNMHMFELEDLCLIGCCYALQRRGFAGVTGDSRCWSYGGHYLPPEFFRRLAGLKAYCLLGSVKMADTGPTPVLGGSTSAYEGTGDPLVSGLIQGNALYQSGFAGIWKPEELIRAIVDKCQSLRAFISIKACRLLDFTEKIVGTTLAADAAALHIDSDVDSIKSTADFSANTKHFHNVEDLDEEKSRSYRAALTGFSSSVGNEGTFPPRIAEACLVSDNTIEGPSVGKEFYSPRTLAPSTGESRCHANSGEHPAEEQVATYAQLKYSDPSEPAASTQSNDSTWGDQNVPFPAVLSTLHNYGTKASTPGLPIGSLMRRTATLFQQSIAFSASCASFAAQAFFGYFFIVLVLYAFSLLS